jgi:hypothetical protein
MAGIYEPALLCTVDRPQTGRLVIFFPLPVCCKPRFALFHRTIHSRVGPARKVQKVCFDPPPLIILIIIILCIIVRLQGQDRRRPPLALIRRPNARQGAPLNRSVTPSLVLGAPKATKSSPTPILPVANALKCLVD